jgi:hypothetical protein
MHKQILKNIGKRRKNSSLYAHHAASSTWQTIIYGLELLKKGLVWRIVNGKLVRAWQNPWIPRAYSWRSISKQGVSRLQLLSDIFWAATGQCAWNIMLLHKHFLQVDITDILKNRPAPRAMVDVLTWAQETYSIFSARSAYRLAKEEMEQSSTTETSRAPDGTRAILKALWRCPAPPKVWVFA